MDTKRYIVHVAIEATVSEIKAANMNHAKQKAIDRLRNLGGKRFDVIDLIIVDVEEV